MSRVKQQTSVCFTYNPLLINDHKQQSEIYNKIEQQNRSLNAKMLQFDDKTTNLQLTRNRIELQ